MSTGSNNKSLINSLGISFHWLMRPETLKWRTGKTVKLSICNMSMNVCRLRLIVHCPDVPVQIQIKRRDTAVCGARRGHYPRVIIWQAAELGPSCPWCRPDSDTITETRILLNSFNFDKTLKIKPARNPQHYDYAIIKQWFQLFKIFEDLSVGLLTLILNFWYNMFEAKL